MTAAEFATAGLTACLPPGTPLMGRITQAKKTGKYRVVATIELFDRLTGVVEVSQDPHFFYGWIIAWRDTGGSPFFWNGSAWERKKLVQPTWFDQWAPQSTEA